MSETTITLTTTARELGKENMDAIEEAVINVIEGWYEGTQIDWDNVWDRIDGLELPDGNILDIAAVYCPAWESIKRRVYKR